MGVAAGGVWAVDVGQAALKALKLAPGEDTDRVRAIAFEFVEYPKVLSQPDADPDHIVREAIDTFLGRHDPKGCKVAISVPGQSGLAKFVKLRPLRSGAGPRDRPIRVSAVAALRTRRGRLGLPGDQRRRGRGGRRDRYVRREA